MAASTAGRPKRTNGPDRRDQHVAALDERADRLGPPRRRRPRSRGRRARRRARASRSGAAAGEHGPLAARHERLGRRAARCTRSPRRRRSARHRRNLSEVASPPARASRTASSGSRVDLQRDRLAVADRPLVRDRLLDGDAAAAPAAAHPQHHDDVMSPTPMNSSGTIANPSKLSSLDRERLARALVAVVGARVRRLGAVADHDVVVDQLPWRPRPRARASPIAS